MSLMLRLIVTRKPGFQKVDGALKKDMECIFEVSQNTPKLRE